MILNLRILAASSLAIVTVALSLPIATPTAAQTYRFEAEQSAFNTIRDTGTRVELSSRDNNRNAGVYDTINLPFKFSLFGQEIESLVPTTSMYLTTNTDAICEGVRCRTPSGPNFTDGDIRRDNDRNAILDSNGNPTLDSRQHHRLAIFPYWSHARANHEHRGFNTLGSRVFHKTEGVRGNRVFTIEFNEFNLNRFFFRLGISTQVRLYEADGSIEFLYQREFDYSSSSSSTATDPVVIGIAAHSDFLDDSNSHRYYTLRTHDTNPTASSGGIASFARRNNTGVTNGQLYRFLPNEYFITPQNLNIFIGQRISYVLPAFDLAIGEVTYSLTGFPEPEFSFNAETRTLTGSSNDPETYDLTYTATDHRGFTDVNDHRPRVREFTLTVTGTNSATAFGSGTRIDNIRGSTGRPISGVNLPEPTAGNPHYTYTITPALPMGLVFDEHRRRLTGTPTAAIPTTTYTYTATDSDEESDTLNFDITIDNVPHFGDASISDIVLYTNSRIETTLDEDKLTLPMAVHGDATVFYSTTPILPIGVSLHNTDRVLSGSPTTAQDAVTYTYTASDANGDSDSLTFRLRVLEDKVFAYSMDPQEPNLTRTEPLDVGKAFRISTPDPGIEGDTPYSAVNTTDPALDGVTFVGSTIRGTITDTDSGDSGTYRYTRTVTDTDGDMASFTYVFTVRDARPVAPSLSTLTFDVDRPIDINPSTGAEVPVILPEFTSTTDFNPPLTYRFPASGEVGSLPARLTFDPETRRLSGIPTAVGDHTVRYIATDGADEAPTEFTITINNNPDAQPVPPDLSNTNFTYAHGDVIDIPLPRFTLRNGTGLTHKLVASETPGTEITNGEMLIGGLMYVAPTPSSDGRIHGTVNIPRTSGINSDSQEYTYSATETNAPTGQMATTVPINFTINIPDPQPEFESTTTRITKNGIVTTLNGTTETSIRISGTNSFPQDADFETADLPLATGGDLVDDMGNAVPLMYSITPDLPNGLVFQNDPDMPNFLRISGRATESSRDPTPYTYTVTDADGDTATLTFSFRVSGNLLPYYNPQFDPDLPEVALDLNNIDCENLPDNPVNSRDVINCQTLIVGQRIVHQFPSIPPGPRQGDGFAGYTLEATDSGIPGFPVSSIPGAFEFRISSFGFPNTITDTADDDAAELSGHFDYTAVFTDSTGSSTTRYTFRFTVIDPRPIAPASNEINSGEPYIFVFDEQIDPVPLPPFTYTPGHTAPDIEYSIPASGEGDLPLGLMFNEDTRVISGRPTEDGPHTVTYTATAGVDVVSTTFVIDITPPVAVTAPWNEEDDGPLTLTFEHGQVLPETGEGAIILPEFLINDDDATLEYKLTETDSNTAVTTLGNTGLTFDSTTRVIHGTATIPLTSSNDSISQRYTYHATNTNPDPDDNNSDNHTDSFTILISIPDTSPDFGSETISNIPGIQNFRIAAVKLPRSISGTAPVTYTIEPKFDPKTPDLPPGITFNPDSRILSGTPTTIQIDSNNRSVPTRTYKYTATDADGGTAKIEFKITVEEDLIPEFESEGKTVHLIAGRYVERAIETPMGADPSTPGNAPVFDVSVRDDPIDGLDFVPARQWQIGGRNVDGTFTPGVARVNDGARDESGSYEYRRTITDANDNKDHYIVTIMVLDPRPIPPSETELRPNHSFLPNVPIAPITLPDFEYTEADSAFSYDPDDNPPTITYTVSGLPHGLEFDQSGGIRRITGTPTNPTGETERATVFYTAIDGDTDRVPVTFEIAIENVPHFGTETIDDIVAVANSREDVTLPAAADGSGDGRLVYSLTPAELPPGLEFNPNTRLLSGTPTTAHPQTTYTYRVMDEDDEGNFLTFNITVQEDFMPEYDPASETRELFAGVAYTGAVDAEPIIAFPDPIFSSLGNGLKDGSDCVGCGRRNTFAGDRQIPGLSVSSNGRTISGTVTDTAGEDNSGTFSYTRTLTDVDGDMGSFTFNFNVSDAVPIAPSLEDRILTQSTSSDPNPVMIRIPEFSTLAADNSDFIYTASGLPTSLSLATTGPLAITGNAPTEIGESTVTITATDGNGQDTASASFTITVVDSARTVLTPPPLTALDLDFEPNQQVLHNLIGFTQSGNNNPSLNFRLLEVGGDMLPVTSLPGGLIYSSVLNQITGTVRGTPRDDMATMFYIYEATIRDSNPAITATTVISISITDLMPSFPSSAAFPTVPTITIDSNPTLAEQFPEAEGGTLPDGTMLTYDIEPTLPDGLDFNSDRQLVGSVNFTNMDDNVDSTFRYVAMDVDGDRAVREFQLTVVDNLPMFAEDAAIANIVLDPNAEISTRTLPAVTNEANETDGSLMYSITPTLPPSIDFDDESRMLMGRTPSADSATTYTYKVVDMDGDSDSLSFRIEVGDLVPVAPTISSIEFTPGEVVNRTLLDFEGGNRPLEYTLTPELPASLEFDAITRVISGTVRGRANLDDSVPSRTYTYSATDEVVNGNSQTRMTTFTIVVIESMPSFGTTTIAGRNIVEDENSSITNIDLPTVTAGTGTGMITYTLTPSNSPTEPIAGLSFQNDPDQGNFLRLSGTPEDPLLLTTFTYTATDEDGDTAVLTFTLTVREDTSPISRAIGESPFMLVPGQMLTGENAVTFPQFSGGNGDLMYSIIDENDNPVSSIRGLSLNPETRVFSGTVTATPGDDDLAETAYFYTATDSDKDNADSASVRFTIQVDDDPRPVAPTSLGFETLRLTPGDPYTTLLPTFTITGNDINGSPLTLTHKVALASAPDVAITELVPGINYNSMTDMISGMVDADPVDVGGTYEFRYSATSSDPADPDTESVPFTIIVTDLVPMFAGSASFPTIPTITLDPTLSISEQFPPAEGGDLPDGSTTLTYTVEPALPLGLTLNSDRQLVSPDGGVIGTMGDDSLASGTYTYVATDADGDRAEREFQLTIVDNRPMFASGNNTITNISIRANTALDLGSDPLPAVMAGDVDGEITYSLTRTDGTAHPEWLMFDANSRVISGTPDDDDVEVINLRYRATDRDMDDTAAILFTLTVTEDLVPEAPAPQNLVFVIGESVDPAIGQNGALLPFMSGDLPLTYTLVGSPTLPQGLMFSEAPLGLEVNTINITDTAGDDSVPATDVAAPEFMYTATDADDDPALEPATFTVRILDPRPVAPDVRNQPLTVGVEIDSLSLPAFMSNTDDYPLIDAPTIVYSLDPESPFGLMFTSDENGGTLMGTPTLSDGEVMGELTVTYTATAGPDVVPVEFTITVSDDPAPRPPTSIPPEGYTFRVGEDRSGSNAETLPPFIISNNSMLEYNLYTTDEEDDTRSAVTDLVGGLMFDPAADARTIRTTSGNTVTGNPGNAAEATTTYYYAATETEVPSGQTTSETEIPFTITIVDDMPSFSEIDPIPPVIDGVALDPVITLPTAVISRDAPQDYRDDITYSIDPASPAGLEFTSDVNGGTLRGTPTLPLGSLDTDFNVMYMAMDADGDIATLPFTITVEADRDITIPAQQDIPTFEPGDTVTGMLNGFSGGNAPLTYNFDTSPTIPTWFVIDKDPGSEDFLMLSGTVPSADDEDDLPRTSYTYTATDKNGDTATATFTIEIEDNQPIPQTNVERVFTPGQVLPAANELDAVRLLPFTSGNGDLTYDFSGSSGLASKGLSIDTDPTSDNFLVLTGTIIPADMMDNNDSVPLDPDDPAPEYTYTATDADMDSGSATFTIRILDPRPQVPTDPAPRRSYSFTVNDDSDLPITLPQFDYNNIDGGVDPDLTYSLSPNLPAGLSFHPTEREIRGRPNTPTAGDPPTFTYTATDDTDSASYTFTIAVVTDPVPNLSASIPNGGYEFRVGDDLPLTSIEGGNDPVVLPHFTFGNDEDGSTLNHFLYADTDTSQSPITSLIGGLMYDSTTRTIHGDIMGTSIPDGDVATYYYAATEKSPPTGQDAVISEPIPFSITIVDDVPSFGSVDPVIGEITAIMGSPTMHDPLPVLVANSDGLLGTGEITYSVTGVGSASLAAVGLSFQDNPDLVSTFRQITGTPTGTLSAPNNMFNYIATDEDGDTATLSFTITVEAEALPIKPSTPPEFTFTVLEDIGVVTALAFSGGNGDITYTEPTPALPDGVSFNTSTAALSGIPTGTPGTDGFVDREYTYTAIDTDSPATEVDDDAPVSSTFTITLIDQLPEVPGDLDQTLQFVPGMNLTASPVELPSFTGGSTTTSSPQLTHSLTDAAGNEIDNTTYSLIAGLEYNQTNREITGMIADDVDNENNSVPAVTYTYTATDADMDEVPATFSIEVIDPRPQAPAPEDRDDNYVFTLNLTVSTTLPVFEYINIDGAADPDLMYTLSNQTNLPVGLGYNEDLRQITGDPTEATAGTPPSFTYTASDGTDSDSYTFTITITDDPEPEPPTIPNGGYTFRVGQVLTGQNAETLPPFTIAQGSTIASHTLIVEGDDTGTAVTSLVGGLMYNQDTRTISGQIMGTSNSDGEVETYSYSAIDNDPPSATDSNNGNGPDTGDPVTFTITIVDDMPSFSNATPIGTVRAIAGVDLDSDIDLPDAESSPEALPTYDDNIMYTIEQSMRAGLMFYSNTNPRTLSGTPALPAGTFPITYTATDADGDSDEFSFTITVEENTRPEAPSINDFVYEVGQNISNPSETLSVGTGGNAPLTYSLSDAAGMDNGTDLFPLITGFSYNPSSRMISGTIAADTMGDDSVPLNASAPAYTYIVTDANGDTDTDTFTLRVVDIRPQAPMAADIDPLVFTAGTAETIPLPEFGTGLPNDLPPNSGISTPSFTFSITGALPAGITLSPDGRMLSATSATVRTTQGIPIVYRADEDGGPDFDEVTLTLSVTDNPPPRPPAIPNGGFTFRVGEVLTGAASETLPPFTISDDSALEYELFLASDNPPRTAVTNTVVGGLTFNPASNARNFSGTVTGNPGNAPSVTTTYIYSATSTNDVSATVRFTITIVDEMPAFASDANIPPIDGTQGTAISRALPVATAGTGTTTYSLTPALPNDLGLTFDDNSDTSDPPMITGTPLRGLPMTEYMYTAMDADGDTTPPLTFTITIEATGDPVDSAPVAPTVLDRSFDAGQGVNFTLDPFTGGNGVLTYTLTPDISMTIPGLSFTANDRQVMGTVTDDGNDNSLAATEFTYTATDEDGDSAMVTFTITVTDDGLVAPEVEPRLRYSPGATVSETLEPFTEGNGNITHRLYLSSALSDPIDTDEDDVTDLVGGLTYTPATLTISGNIPADAPGVRPTEYTYLAFDTDVEMISVTFTIEITDVPSLDMATASAIPTVGANIALVASQAISSRVELALDGLSAGVDIRTLDGPQLRFNPQQQNGGSSGSPVRFGVWYSAASDSLSDTRGEVTWDGTTDSTNLGFDVGFDISESASLVVGILQNSSSTSASYRNTAGGEAGNLSVDFDSTAFYVGLGYDWLDAWFANGSADSTLNDSQIDSGIPASFSYQTIGLTASFEVAESFNIGGKVESLTSDLSLAEMTEMNFSGLQTDSSQLRTTFVANYQLELGEKSNGLLVPKFEFGFRDLSLGTNTMATEVAAVGGSAMETGFGLDYFQKAWGLTLGLDIRSISVENYSSDSTQWQVRWESGDYGSGLSFDITPHSVSETLGGIDSLYSGGFNQYQSVLERQRGGNSAAGDSKGMNFEVGYGIAAGYGTFTPYLKTNNFRGVGSRGEELGIRYQTLSGLELTVKAERSFTPQTIQILGFPLTFMQQESAFTFNTRYSF